MNIILILYCFQLRWIVFNVPNLSSRTMALGSTQPLTEMSSRNFPQGKKRPARRADNLAAIYEPNVWKLWELQPLATLRVTTACYRDSFTFTFTVFHTRCFKFVPLSLERPLLNSFLIFPNSLVTAWTSIHYSLRLLLYQLNLYQNGCVFIHCTLFFFV
jgi:hypothetical protein